MDHPPPCKVSSRFAVPDSGRRLERRVGRKRGLYPCRSAIAPRIVGAFASAVDMQDRGAGMAHRIGVWVRQDFQIMTGGGELVDEIAVKALLQAQLGLLIAPGPPEHPARTIDRR